MLSRGELTFQQQAAIEEYLLQGYTSVVIAEDGTITPAYADWVIEFVLDDLDTQRKYGLTITTT